MYLIPLMFWWDHSQSKACFPPLSVSWFSQRWWLSSICFHNIRPRHISIGGVYPLGPGRLVWMWEEADSGHHHVRLNESVWVIPQNELLLTACSRGERLSFSVWLLLLWSWTACCFRAWGTACLLPPAEKKKEEEEKRGENQFLIKQICKGCIKRCSTFALAQLSVWCDLEDAMRRQTNSVHASWGRRCCFCLTLDW